MPVLSPEYLSSLLVELCKQPAETGWLEFKENIATPGDIYIKHDFMTNSSLRARFGISEQNVPVASRITRETVEDGLIKPYDPDQGRKYAKYIPHWA